MGIIIWLVLFIAIIISFLTPKVPLWVPLLPYIIIVFVRAIEIIENYKDWQKINKRDEKFKLGKIAEDMAGKGLTFSSIRNKAEERAKEDFEFERSKKERKFWVDLVNSLFLK